MEKKKFAVVLAGCGVYDGAEIHEAVATLLAIDKVGASYQCFAPDIQQYHVVNHLTGETMPETRNVLVEAARIARGSIRPLSEFNPDEFDALVFPGGFGVAKNLCTFAFEGPECSVNPDTETAIKKAFDKEIPIGALCIAPALLAKVLGKSMLTIGNDHGTAQAIEKLGAKHKNTEGADVVIDLENKIVTTPCYMLDSPISVIAQGTENAIEALLNLIK
jgi:enhancing lycopene biosynthesis protein 2